jgi:small acid-soluble spore protein H (minor)
MIGNKIIKGDISMDKIRAKEIASSSVMADVTYNGSPIYIESVDDNLETANIHPLNNPLNTQEVTLTNLKEH